MTEAARTHWRPDIQGLRAIAVLAVIAYHAGLPVPGGFVGVDIFFVISGFVITSMLLRRHSAGLRFSAASFYWRRFARLTPALALVVTVSVLLSALLQSPLGPQQTTAFTAIGAMLLVANFVISFTTGDYFSAPAETNPLLHTWSLSVEEQFYLIFPIVLVAAWAVQRRRPTLPVATSAIGLLALASFGAALIGSNVGVGPRTEWLIGFYGPASRAWEFAVGALLAMLPLAPTLPRAVRRLVASAGWILLIASLWTISSTTPFPSQWTLLPVGAAAALLVTGDSGLTSRVLGSRPLATVGDRSYSLYLWHWPLIVFATVIWPFSSWVACAAAVVSVIPSEVAYRTVESPFRRYANRSEVHPRARLVAFVVAPALAAAVALLVVAAFALRPAFESGGWRTTNAGDIGQESFLAYIESFGHPCPGTVPPQPTSPSGTLMCNESQPGQPVDVLLLGDSHAAQLFPAVSERIPAANVAFLDTLGVPVISKAGNKNAWIGAYVDAHPEIRVAVLTAAWYSRGVPDDLRSTISDLKARGIEVVLVNDIPDFPFDAASCKYPRSVVLTPVCTEDSRGLEKLRSAPRAAVDALGAATGAQVFDPWLLFCDDEECSMAAEGSMRYRDLNHLNEEGARLVADALVSDVRGLTILAPSAEGSSAT